MACFNFMLLEALHNYSILAYVVRRDGMLTKSQNVVVGWTLSAATVLIVCSFFYEDYGGSYNCWLQADTQLIFGQLIPIAAVVFLILTLIEAAGAATNFRKLNSLDEEQYISGKNIVFHTKYVLTKRFCTIYIIS